MQLRNRHGGGGEGSFDECHFLFADDLNGDFGGFFTKTGGGGRGVGGHGERRLMRRMAVGSPPTKAEGFRGNFVKAGMA